MNSRVFFARHGGTPSTRVETDIQTIFVGWHCACDLDKRQLDLTVAECIAQRIIGGSRLVLNFYFTKRFFRELYFYASPQL